MCVRDCEESRTQNLCDECSTTPVQHLLPVTMVRISAHNVSKSRALALSSRFRDPAGNHKSSCKKLPTQGKTRTSKHLCSPGKLTFSHAAIQCRPEITPLSSSTGEADQLQVCGYAPRHVRSPRREHTRQAAESNEDEPMKKNKSTNTHESWVTINENVTYFQSIKINFYKIHVR